MYVLFCVVVDGGVKDRKHTENTDRTNLVNNYKVFITWHIKRTRLSCGTQRVTGVAKPIRVANRS